MQEPSFSNGFASPWYGGRMKYPDLWRGCVGSWSPLLGPTGATLFDQSGYANHGPMTGFTLSTEWAVNQYQHLAFNGSSTYARTTLPMPTDAPLSVFAWIRKTTDSQVGTIIGGRDYPTTSACQLTLGSFISGSATTTFSFGRIKFAASTGLSVISSVAVPLNEWCMLGVVALANDDIQLSINGVNVAQTTEYSSSPASSVTRGPLAQIGNAEGASTYLAGQLAIIGIWERAISPSEMLLLAQRPGIMYELDDSNVWGAVEAGGSVPWWAFANRQSRIIGGGVT